MRPSSPRLAIAVVLFVLALAVGFTLLPVSFGVQPSTAHASRLSVPTTTLTGTMPVSEIISFELHAQTDGLMAQQATRLENGNVLLTGGHRRNSYEAEDEAQFYDSAAEVFRWTGRMTFGRVDHTATLLDDGNVLVVGARCYRVYPSENAYCEDRKDYAVDLYIPATGVFTPTGATLEPRRNHTATRLPDGRVLVTGGRGGCEWPCMETVIYDTVSTAEIYDPATGQFTSTASMTNSRAHHTATLLPDGKVLIAGGLTLYQSDSYDYGPLTAELYDPATGEFTPTGSLHTRRWNHTATLLPDGRVLIAGGDVSKAELYDPSTGTFEELSPGAVDPYVNDTVLLPNGAVLLVGSRKVTLFYPATDTFLPAGTLQYARNAARATLLSDGRVLVTGAPVTSGAWSERGTFVPSNTFTGALTLPSGWSTSRAVEVRFSGESEGGSLTGAVHQQSNATIWNWQPLTEGEAVTSTYTFNEDGTLPLYLRLRDSYGRGGIVVSGTVQVDSTAPESSMQPLPYYISTTQIPLRWSGSDATSGVSGYDVEVREGAAGEWTPLLTATTAQTTTFVGELGKSYHFRVWAHDVAGNMEAWFPNHYDAYTTVDTVAPTGSVTINDGALASTARQVSLSLSASDAHGSVTQLRLSTDGTTWGAWLNNHTYPFSVNYTLPQGDGPKTVYVQYRDAAGNISAVVSDTIRLDEAAGSDGLVTINNGALWTNSTSVTLTISAPARTDRMRLSNDGGFAGAQWRYFDTRPTWNIIPYGGYAIPRTVYVRVRNIDGTQSTVYSDDIIYDPVPPTGTLSIQSVTSSSVNVNLRANDPDNLSGVAAMRVALTSNLSQVAWQPYASSRTLPRNGTAPENVRAYAQFRDGAGNVSSVVCAAASGSCPAGGSTATPTATATRTPTRTPGATATPSRTPTPSATNPPLPSARRPYSDFNGDGRSDILWRHLQTGENALYQMNGAIIEQKLPINVTPIGYKVVGIGDFNGDGKADILLRHSTTGLNYLFLMNGATIVRKIAINTVADLNWTVAGVADFTGDGRADILWRNIQTGENALYQMNGGTIEQNLPINVTPIGYKVVGVGDFNGDARADILLRHSTTGANYLFLMNGAAILRKHLINTVSDLKWTVAGVAEFTGDGRADILWRNIQTGENALYQMNGVIIEQKLPINVTPTGYRIAGVGDFNGDGKADILLRHSATGLNYLFVMNGATIVRKQVINTEADLKWTIMNHDYLVYGPASQAATTSSSRVAWQQPPDEPESASLVVVPGDMGGAGVEEAAELPDSGESGGVPEGVGAGQTEEVPEDLELEQPVSLPGGDVSHWLFIPTLQRR